MSLQIPLEDILSATNNFADENIIGKGGFGRVYKGQLQIHGQLIDIAARRLNPAYGQGSKEFWTEILLLNRLKHSNLVCIVGFCDEKDEKIIINKYEARGSLNKYLSDPTLTWLQRLQICYKVALALSYIHYDVGRDFSVIHRNIKSSKILLSDDWEPKLSGYGLSITNTTTDRNRLLLEDACGTLVYIDPTYLKAGLVSHKSDMYSFGVVLFEVLCGRLAIIQVNDNWQFSAKLAKSHYESGTLDEIIHPDLQEQIDPQSLSIFSKTAYACLNEVQSKRPDADQIVKRLEKALKFQLKQQTPEHSIVDLEVEDALLKERSIVNLEVEDALLKERTIIDLEIEDAFFKGKYTEYLKIPLRDIRLATDNFSEKYLVGKGGFSMVYKCKLPNTENDVVIKRLLTTENSQGEQLFLEEIEMLSACKHPNIISLLGLCYEGGHMILVLEYACKGSLDDLLEGNDCLDGFTWDQRIQICLDVAHGLKYLHTGMDDKNVIIHRDIKSANILLDQNGRAKIADFGLSKLRSSYEKGNTLNTNSSKPKSCDTPLHASSHEELHDIVPSYSNIDSNLPPSDANCDPGYGNIDSNLPPSDAKNDPSYDNADSNLPPSDANRDKTYGNVDSNLPPSGAKRDPSYDNIESNLPLSDANRDPSYDNIDSNLSPNDANRDPSYGNIDSDLLPSHAYRDPSYGNVDSNLSPSDANRDPSFDNFDCNLPPSDADRDPVYDNIDSNLPPSDANRDAGYDNIDSNLPPSDGNRDPSYDNIDSDLLPSDANHDPSYGNIDSNLPPSDGNRDPSYDNIDSDLLPSDANHDPSYGNVDSNLSPSDANGDLSYRNIDSDLLPSDANRDPSYGNVDSHLSPSDANRDSSYSNLGNNDSNLPPTYVNCDPTYDNINGSLPPGNGNINSSFPPSYANHDPSYYNLDPSNIPTGSVLYFRSLSNSNNSFCGAQNFNTTHSLGDELVRPNYSNYGYDFFSGGPSRNLARPNFSNYDSSFHYVPELIAPGLSGIVDRSYSAHGYRNSIAGTLVYLDPEYRKTGRLKKEVDIYSFGVVLFEVLCGKLAYDAIYTADSKTGIASIARKSFKQGNLIEMIDPKLNNILDENISVRNKEFYKKSLDTFVEIAHQCVTETQTNRPEIEVVIKELEKALHLLTSGEFAEYQIPLEEIELATKNFHEENFIGRGTSEDHFYKGLLMRSGKPINVVARRFSGNEIQFWKEISMLSSPKHKKFKNVVSLVGFCLEKSEKIVIYDIEVHGTLDQLLSDPTNFTWPRRLKVCLGVADALRKIHYDVIHCDINSSKIFVDKDWEAKVFGFELSTEYPESWMHRLLFSQYFDTSSGCKDPDYVGTKRLMPKYDVYSFGVMLFEILCWRKAIMTGDGGVSPSLVKMAMDHYKEKNIDKIIDPDLRKQMDEQSLKTFSEVAYHCLDERVKRPTMDKVFRELEDASVLQGEHDFLVHSKLKDEALPSNNLKEKMVIPLEKILVATDNFNLDLAVGKGGFAFVYKADIDCSDIPSLSSMEGKKTVAVKRILSRSDNKGEQGYLAEIELLTGCKHKNIVSLLGYCRKESEMILVYEFAPNGSLGDYLCNPGQLITNLTWVQRIKICLDIASGLKYLHTDMDGKPRIIHRDIKSDNILLDKEMNGKIADFGLSRFQPKNQETGPIQTQYIAGTSVYTDPEFVKTKKYKKESDTYSFGVVLFEILSGTMAYDPIYLDENKNGLAHVARRRFTEGTLKELIDPKLIEEDDDNIFTLNRGPNQDSFDAFSKIAYECLAETQDKRPTIEVIIMELNKALEHQGGALVLTRFRLNDIKSAIKSSANSIGSDASDGIVSKAKFHFVSKSSSQVEKKKNVELEKEPINVAIKHISSREDGQGDQQGFFEEIDVLTRYKHGNIVSLLGFCDQGHEMILVFEDASSGSIIDYLRKNDNKATWAQRLKWCLDIARGLNHLHTKMGGAQGIIHGDIKSANIQIGKNLEAKIAYYGLSKSYQENQMAKETSNSVGPNVHLDPEYEKTGKLSKKSDVFFFWSGSIGGILWEVG